MKCPTELSKIKEKSYGKDFSYAAGVCVIYRESRANAVGTFTFTVDNIALAGYSYNPAANVQTSASIMV